jgi:uncharacterized membrane protein YccC
MSDVAVQEERPVARPLRVLVSLIKEDLKQAREVAEQASKPYFIAAGQKMAEARDGNGWSIGELCSWTKRNFNIGRSQTLVYLSVQSATSNLSAPEQTQFNSMDDFRRRVLGHERVPGSQRDKAWREDVNQNIDRARREAARLREEDLTRQQERDAEKALALRLIDIGYKILIKELHPDKGGSRDATQRLNRVRDRLKQHA